MKLGLHGLRLKSWHWWTLGLTSPMWLLLILFSVQWSINNVIFSEPWFDTLSLDGRKILVSGGEGLILHTYGKGNKNTELLIPNSKGGGPSTIIMDDGTIVWNKVTDTNYELWKYQGGATTQIATIKLFDLHKFELEREKGIAPPIEAVQNMTGYVSNAPFIPVGKDKFAFLDAIVTDIDSVGMHAAIRRNIYDVNGTLIERASERASERSSERQIGCKDAKFIDRFDCFDFKILYKNQNNAGKSQFISPSNLTFPSTKAEYYFGISYIASNRYSLNTSLYPVPFDGGRATPASVTCELGGECEIKNVNSLIFVYIDPTQEKLAEQQTRQVLGYCAFSVGNFFSSGCQKHGYFINRIVLHSKSWATTLFAQDYSDFFTNTKHDKIEIGTISADHTLLVVNDNRIVSTTPRLFGFLNAASTKGPGGKILYIK